MTRISFTLFAVSLTAIGAASCARTGDKAFRARAAEDLSCPASELYIVQKWEGSEATKHASGCGREALYVRECQHEGCLWKMQQPAAAPATTATAAPTTSASAAPATSATAAP
jgi:hypothetical protein